MSESGYSGTPLSQKLGLKDGMKIWLVHAPDSYESMFDRWPENMKVYREEPPEFIDFIHWFCTDASHLSSYFDQIKARLERDGLLWVSWPKASSAMKTNLKRDLIRQFILAGGLVDVKVAAINEDWSGLKFVYRIKDR